MDPSTQDAYKRGIRIVLSTPHAYHAPWMSAATVIAQLVDDAVAAGLGSAAAVSIGDGGCEIRRIVRGHSRRIPDLGAPIDESTLFDLSSLTKPMATTALAMVLVGERRLDLDAPIRRWFGAAASPGTVRHALGHAAGFAAHVDFYQQMRAVPPVDPRRELIARAIAHPVDRMAPVYSDLGFMALGAIIERVADMPLEDAFADLIAGPLDLTARFAPHPVANAVATELDDRGLVCGLVHDENAYFGGRVCGHAGLFASIADVAKFAAAMLAPHRRFSAAVVERFFTDAPTRGASWRLGWDTPANVEGVSHAGDRWPRTGVGHLGFTGTSLWLDIARKRWVAILTNRVHPSRHGDSAADIKRLRRAIGDLVTDAP